MSWMKGTWRESTLIKVWLELHPELLSFSSRFFLMGISGRWGVGDGRNNYQ